MNPLRVAIVGCGRISDLHQLGYRGRDDAKIVAVCDTNKAHAKKKAKEWGVEKVYDKFEDVLADRGVDAVELLTPHHLALPHDHPGSPGGQAYLSAEADGFVCCRSG